MGLIVLLLVVLRGVLLLFLALLTLRALLGWIPLFVRGWEPKGGLRVLAEFVLTVTDPPLRLFGRFLPPLRLGGITVDTAFTVLYFVVLLVLGWLPF